MQQSIHSSRQGRPRKRFSQNFLVDRHYVERIVAAIAPVPGDRLVEIGPGRGALTRPLLERAERMRVIEIDRDLAAALRAEFPPERLEVITADALAVDLAGLGDGLRIAGNLPYHVSSPLLFHCARFAESLRDLHFMLQAEVVERMAARPGTPEYGRLSVTLQSLFGVEKLFRVPPGAFHPAPQVDSAVVRLVPLGAARPEIHDRPLFEAAVLAGFGQRRKTLRNALQPLIDADRLRALDIDPGARAETLSVAQFVTIANAIAAARRDGTPSG
jgi:16S rRNA (adenine1518-N6/adenine1519-N6)-dimethyltransferase